MAKKAVLATFSFVTRVIIDDDISEDAQMEQIINQSKLSIQKRVDNDELNDNFEGFEDDKEVPYVQKKHQRIYKIVKNLDDHEGYNGEDVEIICEDEENLFTVQNQYGTKWTVDREEIKIKKFYYQPDFEDENFDESIFSFEVYHKKENAERAFPNVKIIEYSDDDIEDVSYIDFED